jgi:putative hemolysin
MIQALILIALIATNAFFAASEMALITLNDTKIKIMADDGHKKAQQLVRILASPTEFLSTIQIGITLAGFMASAIASVSFSDALVEQLMLVLPFNQSVIQPVVMLLITLSLSYVSLVFGELVPKRLAMNYAESIAFASSGILLWIGKITLPFVRLLSFSTRTLLRLFGINSDEQPEKITEEEIRMMVDVGEEKGTIRETEKEMINNIFEFDNKEVADIMTHRTDVSGIDVESSLDEVKTIILEQQYTRFPVYEDNIDHIIGMIHLKDLLKYIDVKSTETFDLRKLMRKPYFVPDSKHLDELFFELQKNRTHFAVVIDEYGGTAGIVTIEDLIEEILGDIEDEYDEEDVDLRQISTNVYEALGSMELEDLNERAELNLPESDLEDYDTLSGLLIAQIGRIPDDHEVIEILYHDIRFKVLKIEDKVIDKVRVIKAKQKDE